ncbi:hypothetical protein APICC_04090 [Apis cerana cerana]|uniref:Uncharacterized protein n=1 Tax=Apis cerana cerana TaxID=94128 RepID=A0A2A3E8W8_APICC|nr:hypothetical protein APICC_04090 [Apis cerana cerana]
MSTDTKVKTWSPAVPCKIPDNIISSQFASQKVFIPSYEKEKRPCIEQLLTNEYQRIWWQEKELWDKRYGTKKTTKQLLQRMIIKKKVKPVIDILTKNIKPKRKKATTVTKIVQTKEPKDITEEKEKVSPKKEKTPDEIDENKNEESI